MNSLPTWAVWSIVLPLVLLSPVLALLLALSVEAMVVAMYDAPVPVGVVLGAGAVGLFLLRKRRARAFENVN
jgi:hypothetical protein